MDRVCCISPTSIEKTNNLTASVPLISSKSEEKQEGSPLELSHLRFITENTELETNLSSDSVSAPRAPRRGKEEKTVLFSFFLLGALGADTESEERFVSNSV